MKKSNIFIFLIVILVILAIFGFAIWSANKSIENVGKNTEQLDYKLNEINDIVEQNTNNEIQQNQINNVQTQENNTVNYDGEWFISEEAYINSEKIDQLMEERENGTLTGEEFERELNSITNSNVVELDVDNYFQNQIKFDFILTSPAPTQREAKLDDIVVNLTNNIGTFTYTDNWGTSGNGTITLEENRIILKLETTSAAEGALWGVEGIYTFEYKRAD